MPTDPEPVTLAAIVHRAVEAEDPAVQLAAAVATYLAFRRDEVDVEPHELLALAARAEFAGHPPDDIRALLAERGVEL